MRRSWYILAFQAPLLPEIMLTANDCEALDAGARTGPAGMKTDGAITVQDIERKGSAWVALHQDLMRSLCRLQPWHQHMFEQHGRQSTAAGLCSKKPKLAAQRISMSELSQPMQTDYKCIASSCMHLECTGKSAWFQSQQLVCSRQSALLHICLHAGISRPFSSPTLPLLP